MYICIGQVAVGWVEYGQWATGCLLMYRSSAPSSSIIIIKYKQKYKLKYKQNGNFRKLVTDSQKGCLNYKI